MCMRYYKSIVFKSIVLLLSIRKYVNFPYFFLLSIADKFVYVCSTSGTVAIPLNSDEIISKKVEGVYTKVVCTVH